MALFRRRPPEPDAQGPRDALLPALSVEQAAAATRLIHDVVAEHGREGTVAEGALTLDDGSVLGLHNLSCALADTRFRRWRPVVEEHIGSLLGSSGRRRTQAAPSAVFAQLRPAEQIPARVAYPALEPLPGITALVAIDMPDVVHELLHGLDEAGRDAAGAYDLARRNLADLPLPDHQALEAEEGRPTSAVHLFVTDDLFGAARVLVLPDLLRRALGVEIPPHGVLVAVPNRHLLAVHVPTDETMLPALNTLAGLAAGESESRPGPISPDVFHVLPDLAASRVTRVEDGAVHVDVEGSVADLFAALGLVE